MGKAFRYVEHLTETHIHDLNRLYQSEWWTRGRTLEDIRTMLIHSDLIMGFCEPDTDMLIAFARVLTDRIYKALIFDVIVDARFRHQGLGALLMHSICEHPELQAVRHLELYCLPEMIPFYRKWGFTDVLGSLQFMRLERAINP